MKKLNPILLVLLAVSSVFAAQTKSPVILLQEGLYAEETEGDLEKAISLYEQVLNQYKDVERLAARATYQLGMCYLKKSQTEQAAQYFREAVNYYPEQIEITKMAQAQLNKLHPTGDQNMETQIISYMIGQHIKAYNEAKKMGIRLNSIAYYVDESFVKIQGGFITIENNTGATIDSEITVGEELKE